uniref:Uncharacterized protein n=1 Tax=Siphoviridae sp. ctx254 TaxID=2825737 RepID=A0A8S5TVU3_9CAUD|nr:MAG TPA: hypothetical protein [Siphoviridae sp. ctx254]
MQKALRDGIGFFLRSKDGISNGVVCNDDRDIDFIPVADIHARNTIYGDFDDGVIAFGRGVGEIRHWLDGDVDETGILEVLLDNTVVGGHTDLNFRHLDFAHSKVRCGYFFILQAGKLGLMGGEGSAIVRMVGGCRKAKGQKNDANCNADQRFLLMGTAIFKNLLFAGIPLPGKFFITGTGTFRTALRIFIRLALCFTKIFLNHTLLLFFHAALMVCVNPFQKSKVSRMKYIPTKVYQE